MFRDGKQDLREDSMSNAAKRLRRSMGLRSGKENQAHYRYRKRKMYPTFKKINKHMTRKYSYMLCLSKRRDILSRY